MDAKMELLKLLETNNELKVSSVKNSMMFDMVMANLPKILNRHSICVEVAGEKFELSADGRHDRKGEAVIVLNRIERL